MISIDFVIFAEPQFSNTSALYGPDIFKILLLEDIRYYTEHS